MQKTAIEVLGWFSESVLYICVPAARKFVYDTEQKIIRAVIQKIYIWELSLLTFVAEKSESWLKKLLRKVTENIRYEKTFSLLSFPRRTEVWFFKIFDMLYLAEVCCKNSARCRRNVRLYTEYEASLIKSLNRLKSYRTSAELACTWMQYLLYFMLCCYVLHVLW